MVVFRSRRATTIFVELRGSSASASSDRTFGALGHLLSARHVCGEDAGHPDACSTTL
jgi:hypothetical protein